MKNRIKLTSADRDYKPAGFDSAEVILSSESEIGKRGEGVCPKVNYEQVMVHFRKASQTNPEKVEVSVEKCITRRDDKPGIGKICEHAN